MDPKEFKIAIGLALENAIATNTCITDVDSLYSNPTPEQVIELHDMLVDSKIHEERVVAFWLQYGIDQGPISSDINSLIMELTQMEVLLEAFIKPAGDAWKDVNDWMNFISNSHHHLLRGFWIDSKILLSRGLEVSRRDSIEQLKEDEDLVTKVTIFQQATESYYNELKELPVKLFIPETVIDVTLSTQELMLDLMKTHGAETPDEVKYIQSASLCMSQAIRNLMSSLFDEAKHDITTSRNSLIKLHEIIKDERKQEISSKIEELEKILLHPNL